MKKKKWIIVCIFLSLIVFTGVYTLVSAVKSYQYDMDPANGVDIMEGMGAAMLILLGGFAVFYELDLFYTVYCFFVKPKTVTKSVLNILSNVSLLLQFFALQIARALSIGEETVFVMALFFIYVALRIAYLTVSTRDLAEER